MKLEIRNLFYSSSVSSHYFSVFMQVVVIASIVSILGYDSDIPVNIGSPRLYQMIEYISMIIYLIEMVLRFVMTYNECKRRKPYSFIKYITSLATLIDILSIIPYYLFPYPYRILVLIARIVKIARFNKSIMEVLLGIQEKRFELGTIFFIFSFFLFGSSIVMFILEKNVNPNIHSLFDAFWWSIVTITTVGYGDIKPVTYTGKIAASVLMVVGLSGIAVLTGIITAGFTNRLLKLKLNMGGIMEKKIAKLSNHYIICGYGRVGEIVAKELARFNKQFVIIESNKDRAQKSIDEGHLTIVGSATDEEILRSARISDAMGIALVMDSDADNIYTLITAKDENRDILAIARSNTEESIKKFIKLGAKTISPYQSSGYDISRMLISPRTAEFVSIIMQSDKTIEMGEFFITKTSIYANKIVKDTDIRSKYNIIIIAILTKDKETIFNPKANDTIRPNSTLICVGTKEDMEKFEKVIAS